MTLSWGHLILIHMLCVVVPYILQSHMEAHDHQISPAVFEHNR